MSSSLVRLWLFVLVAVWVVPAFGQQDTLGHIVQLDPPNVSLVDQDGVPHRLRRI